MEAGTAAGDAGGEEPSEGRGREEELEQIQFYRDTLLYREIIGCIYVHTF